jgi:hypothetical protein
MNNDDNIKIRWITESIHKDEYSLNAAITKLENGLLLIISENEYKLGSISISIPHKFQVGGESSTSTTIPIAFGKKNELISKALGQRLSHKTNSMVISIINIDEKNQKMIKDCAKLMDKILEKMF